MSHFRYAGAEHWYKGQCHAHTVASDGAKTAEALAAMYVEAGYDFLFLTDHWVGVDPRVKRNGAPLLLLDGVEFDGRDREGRFYHVVCLGRYDGPREDHDLEAAMRRAREQGCILVLAHPQWSGNDLADAIAHPFDGVEVYNHAASCDTGRSCGLLHWDRMLDTNPRALAFAVDDTHTTPANPVWRGGWIAVAAEECSEDPILEAIRAGRFYASQGPEIRELRYARRSLSIRTSPAAAIRLVGKGWNALRRTAEEGKTLSEAVFELPKGWPYMRIEVEDAYGRRAWTHTLF